MRDRESREESGHKQKRSNCWAKTAEVRWQETGDVRAVYRKWINIYFLKKFFLWKYNKCKMCDYSDIPIAYVLREGVIVILRWARIKAHINIFWNAEHTGNLRKPAPPADLSSQHSSPGKGARDPSSYGGRPKHRTERLMDRKSKKPCPPETLHSDLKSHTNIICLRPSSATHQSQAFWWIVDLSKLVFFPETQAIPFDY